MQGCHAGRKSKLAYVGERAPVTPGNGNCGLINFILSGPQAEVSSSGKHGWDSQKMKLPCQDTVPYKQRTLEALPKSSSHKLCHFPSRPGAHSLLSLSLSLLSLSLSLSLTHTHTQLLCSITPFPASSPHNHLPQKKQNKEEQPGGAQEQKLQPSASHPSVSKS